MKPIHLSLEEMRGLLAYDPDTGAFTWKTKRPGRSRMGGPAGTSRRGRYVDLRVSGQAYKAHRLAWFIYYGVDPPFRIDHKDGDPTNNRISNLRETSHSQNIANSKLRSDSTSGLKGVTFFEGKWMATIHKEGKRHHLGLFTTPEAAHAAYQEAARRLFGDFARFS